METSLLNLIKALQIFAKYGNPTYPTHCEHDELFIMINAEDVSKEDVAQLDELGFSINGNGNFSSYSYGSA